MKVTALQIEEWISEYLSKGYGDKVLKREWRGGYIRGHAPWNNTEDCYHKWLELINQKLDNLNEIKDFEALYNEILALKISGIGTLTIYDTATMIGCPNGVYPQQIYLHAGAAEGADALGIEGETATKEQFVAACDAFEKLEPIQIEDFLCIYKRQLKGETTKSPQGYGCC